MKKDIKDVLFIVVLLAIVAGIILPWEIIKDCWLGVKECMPSKKQQMEV